MSAWLPFIPLRTRYYDAAEWQKGEGLTADEQQEGEGISLWACHQPGWSVCYTSFPRTHFCTSWEDTFACSGETPSCKIVNKVFLLLFACNSSIIIHLKILFSTGNSSLFIVAQEELFLGYILPCWNTCAWNFWSRNFHRVFFCIQSLVNCERYQTEVVGWTYLGIFSGLKNECWAIGNGSLHSALLRSSLPWADTEN